MPEGLRNILCKQRCEIDVGSTKTLVFEAEYFSYFRSSSFQRGGCSTVFHERAWKAKMMHTSHIDRTFEEP
jgi:hypothetical protein